MDNKIFTTVLVLVIAVLVGLSLVSRQTNAPLISQLNSNQNKMAKTLDTIATSLLNKGAGADAEVNAILIARLNTLEARFKALEAKVNAAPAPAAPRQAPPRPDANKVHDIPVAHTPLIGPKNAKVTITEFMDLECPFCARFHPPIVEALKAYPKDVNYLAKSFPLSFHKNAKPAAKAAFAAAEQGKFEEMLNGLLANGRNLNEATYDKIAADIGLDMKKFKADLKKNDAKYEQQIVADMTLGGQVGVRGTPTFFINGKNTNARDFNALKAEIEAIINGS